MKNRTNKANRSYMKRRRKAAGRKGKCTTCCMRQPILDKKTCEDCLAANERRKSGIKFCVRCCSFHASKCLPVMAVLRRAA